MKKKLLNLIKFIFLISILLGSNVLSTSIAADEQNVILSIMSKPKIDIVLAKSRTKTDVTNFETDIKNSLENLNIDTADVRITSVKAQKVNMETAFKWQQDINSSIGSISITNNGQDVVMRGNPSNPGKNAIWIIPDGNQEQKFKFNYNINFGDSFNAAGMLLRVKQQGNTLTGYMLSFNKSGQDWYSTAGANGGLWKFTYQIGTNTSNMIKTKVAGININTSGTLEVKATDAEIVITGGGANYTYNIPGDDQTIGNGFGFFSDHYSHDCDDIGAFSLTGINLETTVVRSFNEILREPNWRENSYRFLVNIDDHENQELKSETASGEIATRLLNDNIYFVSWGKESNRLQFENLILNNDGKGKIIDNSEYQNSINITTQYIKEIIDALKEKQTIIVNEPIKIQSDPSGILDNTIDEQWPYGKWKINHDYTYYENNLGQFAESGKYMNDLIKTFDKTGRFEITYRNLSITPKEIFVHRRPVAQMKIERNDTNINLISESYDLDKISDNNGIAEEEWKWKAMDSTEWTNGKLTTIDPAKTYLVQLRVKDFQGEWSYPNSKYVTGDPNALPVAMYNITNTFITKYLPLQINDTSYDPAGREITSRLWEVYKGGSKIYSGETPKTDYLNDGLGEYTMYLTVTNSEGITSERYGRTFTVLEDTMVPEVVANPIQADWTRSTTVNLQFSDQGGSLYRGYQYAITDNQETPEQWSEEVKKAEDNITIESEGIKYLHIIAHDNANNVSNDRVLGPYKIDRSGPTVEITGDFQTITTEGVVVSIKSEDLLSGLKKVYVNNNPLNGMESNAIKITQNGTYVIKAEDNIGNITEKEIIVTNAYKNCDAGLEHPIYSSNYDSCPICELIKGLQVTNETVVYDAKEKHVTYDNPQNATIVEYYNGVKQNPIEIGTYKYDLKVVYEGKEYNTGLIGTFQITKKEITIKDIVAKNRPYNATNLVELSGGSLVGVEAGDKVGFTLPETGTIERKDIGEYFVTIPEIVLTGEKANNYTLKQPGAEDVSVVISKKEITIKDIVAKNRPYDATNVVELSGGSLVGVENGDEIGFTLPATGTIERKDIGEYFVTIPEIVLTGEKAKDYTLKQPGAEDISVIISKKEITIENIEAVDRQYDGTNVVSVNGGNLIGIEESDEVGFVLEKGTIPSENIGEYFVTIPEIKLIGNKAHNYQLNHPNEDAITVKIDKRELTITGLKGKERKYDKTDVVEIIGGELQNVVEDDEVIPIIPKTGIIENKDIGTWNIKIDTIELDGADSFNYILKQPAEEEIKGTIIKPDVPQLHLETFINQINGEIIEKVEPVVKIEVVEGKETEESNLEEEKAEEDKNEEISKEDTEENKNEKISKEDTEENKNEKISKENTEENKNEEISKEDTEDDKNEEANKENLNKKELKVYYEKPEKEKEIRYGDIVQVMIRVYNEGKGAGYAQKITNIIPEGMKFVEDNKINKENGWKQTDKKTVETTKLKFDSGSENEIEALKENKIDFLDIPLILEVTEKQKLDEEILNKTIVEQVDIRKEKIDFEDEKEKTILPIKIHYTDFIINNVIKKMVEVNKNGQKEHFTAVTNEQLAKVEIDAKNIDNTKLQVIYQISVTNNGNAKGKATEVAMYLPEGLEISMQENSEWEKVTDNTIYCKTFGDIKPTETQIKEVVGYIDVSQIAGTKSTTAMILASQDIDQRILEKE